jgi:hypothetical protein
MMVTAPSLSISPEKVCFFALKAREFDVKDVVTDPDSGSNASDDAMISVLEDHPDDPTHQELKSFIDALTEDEQVDLVALTWLGRGDGTIDEWDDLRQEAARLHNNRTAAYLLGKPMLADHLEEGLCNSAVPARTTRAVGLKAACVSFSGNLGENGGRIARSGADLEYLFPAGEPERLDHECHDVGLRDGLTLLDRQRSIFVGEFAKLLGQEGLARDTAHGVQDQLGAHPPGNDGFLNHLVSKLIKVSLEMKVHRGIPRTVIYVLWASARRWSLQGGGTDRGVVPEATNHTERFRSASNSQPSQG